MRWSVLFLMLPALAFSDEVTDAIDQAKQLYSSGQTQQAITQLDYASQLIRQSRATDLQAFLPEPLDGWSAAAASSQAVGTAMFGGGTTAEREFSQDGKTVTVRILTDSPLMQSMMMMMANPMIATAQGGSLQLIGGQQAIVNPDGVQLVVANRFLVQVEGTGASQADMVAYAEAVDIQGLAGFN